MFECNIFAGARTGSIGSARYSTRDGRKADKLAQRWLGPYRIGEHIGKGVYRLGNPATDRILKKAFNGCRYVFTHVAHYVLLTTTTTTTDCWMVVISFSYNLATASAPLTLSLVDLACGTHSIYGDFFNRLLLNQCTSFSLLETQTFVAVQDMGGDEPSSSVCSKGSTLAVLQTPSSDLLHLRFMQILRWHVSHSAEVNENINMCYSQDQCYS